MLKSVFAAAVVVLVVGVGVTHGALNYDPALPAPAPVLDQGWASDTIYNLLPATSSDSPYVYSFAFWTIFRITDAFVDPAAGDIFQVSDFGVPILTTAFNTPPVRVAFGGLNPGGDGAWVSTAYTHGEVLLAPGAHSLTIGGVSAPGGLSAGFFTRIDTAVPEPATLLIWSALAVVGGACFWCRRKAA